MLLDSLATLETFACEAVAPEPARMGQGPLLCTGCGRPAPAGATAGDICHFPSTTIAGEECLGRYEYKWVPD